MPVSRLTFSTTICQWSGSLAVFLCTCLSAWLILYFLLLLPFILFSSFNLAILLSSVKRCSASLISPCAECKAQSAISIHAGPPTDWCQASMHACLARTLLRTHTLSARRSLLLLVPLWCLPSFHLEWTMSMTTMSVTVIANHACCDTWYQQMQWCYCRNQNKSSQPSNFSLDFLPTDFFCPKGTFVAVWGLSPHSKTPHPANRVTLGGENFLSKEKFFLKEITYLPSCFDFDNT